jgi:putative sigma-54 modulation protein
MRLQHKNIKEKGAIFMKIKITGKELKITEAINDYVERKMDRIDKYFEDSEAEVTLKTEKNEQIAEIYVVANGEKYRAVTENKDMYASIDKDIDILEGQIRKSKTKKEKMIKESSLKNMDVDFEKENEIENEIIKTSYYEIKPITPEDAVLELQERPTHNFLVFINVDTGKVNVVHKLKDGKNYGLVEPEA